MKFKLLKLLSLALIPVCLASCNSNADTEEETAITSKTYTGYYQKMNGHLGSDFKSTLNSIISSNVNPSSYSNAWTILAAADEDPDNSDNIKCFYSGLSIPKENHEGLSVVGYTWNREHVWAKSHGFGDSESNYAYYDAFHLHATEAGINNTRGNLSFDETEGGSKDSYGNSWDSDSFEPRDEVKGDVARSLFYMVVRYDNENLDLELLDEAVSSSSKEPTLGKLSTLVKWAYEDPVSEEEKNRNEVVYKYQNNRNPFIDNPEYVYYLYPEESKKLGITEENVMDEVSKSGATYNNPAETSGEAETTKIEAIDNAVCTLKGNATSYATEDVTKELNLDPNIFKVTYMNNSATSALYLKSGEFRIYTSGSGNGGELVVSTRNDGFTVNIKSIAITYANTTSESNLTVYKSDGISVVAENGAYTINDTGFIIKNTSLTTGSASQVRISSIDITYSILI